MKPSTIIIPHVFHSELSDGIRILFKLCILFDAVCLSNKNVEMNVFFENNKNIGPNKSGKFSGKLKNMWFVNEAGKLSGQCLL